MKPKPQKKDHEEEFDRIDYPRLDIKTALLTLDKVVRQYADIIPYERLAKLATGSEVTRGGTFGSVTKSMKAYGFMERYSKTEMKVTDFGKKVVDSTGEQQKNLLKESFLRIKIFHSIFQRYGGKLPNKQALSDYVEKNTKIEKREAGRIVNVYIKNYAYLDLDKMSSVPHIQTSEAEESIPDASTNITRPHIDSEMIEIAFGLGSLFPTQDFKTRLDELHGLVEKSRLEHLKTFLSTLKSIGIDLNEEQLSKLSNQALEALRKDIKI